MTKTHKKAAKGSKLASTLKNLLGRGGAKKKAAVPAPKSAKAGAPRKGASVSSPAPKAQTKGAPVAKGKPVSKPMSKTDTKKAGVRGAAPATVPAKGQKGVPASAAVPAQLVKGAKAARGSLGSSLKRTSVSDEQVCREVACEGLATSGGYCRMHYIKNWKKIKRKELILKEKKLNQYIEELVAKYPDKYIEAIRQDLANDKDFAKVIYDLDLDESVDDFDVEAENVDSLIDNIRRDFEDEGEGGF
jgi:hypothetical protein